MRAVEVAIDAALVIMQNGGSTVAAERAFSSILKRYGEEGVTAAWRLDFIVVTAAAEGGSSTFVREVGTTGMNLARASAAMVLADRLAEGNISIADFPDDLERIKNLPSAYKRWLTIAAAACAGGFYSRTVGGDWGSLGIAFVAAGVGQSLRSLLQARKVAVVPLTLACATVSALIAAAGLRIGFSNVEPATLISSVIYMVPGLPLINGFIDMISHKHLLVGMQRMMNAAFLFLVLAIAIAFADSVVS